MLPTFHEHLSLYDKFPILCYHSIVDIDGMHLLQTVGKLVGVGEDNVQSIKAEHPGSVCGHSQGSNGRPLYNQLGAILATL